MKTIISLLLFATASFAAMIEIPLRCITVNNETRWLSDINQPKLTVYPDLGVIEQSNPYTLTDFSAFTFTITDASHTKAYTFTTTSFDPDELKKFTSNMSGIASCAVMSTQEALQFTSKQRAPYITFTDLQGSKRWAFFTRLDSLRISNSGGRITQNVIELKDPIDVVSAANEMYKCGPNKFGWIDAYNEVDYTIIQWQASNNWLFNKASFAIRYNTIIKYMPEHPIGCIEIASIPVIAELVMDELAKVPCEESGKKYYTCIDKR